MDEWLNVILRTLMCGLFIFWVVKPMLMALAHKELNMVEIDELADTVTQAAFNAWQKDGSIDPLSDPQLALYMAEHPELQLPQSMTLDEAGAHEQSLIDASEAAAAEEKAKAEALNAELAAAAQAQEQDAAAEVVLAQELAPTQGLSEAADTSTSDAVGVVEAAVDEEEDMSNSLDEMKKRMKAEQQKAKPKIPTELLTNANSYEDKLVVVQMITDQDQNRVAMAIRNMIRAGK
ncbi:MAG: hypothetical protein EBV20_03520 [Betaproteobacteria bacterium]|nr:hypothetical protein [Betaproteobacteria bacterium]NBP43615.1 hypothetical protein [Betaproteobacteria bacterium]